MFKYHIMIVKNKIQNDREDVLNLYKNYNFFLSSSLNGKLEFASMSPAALPSGVQLKLL